MGVMGGGGAKDKIKQKGEISQDIKFIVISLGGRGGSVLMVVGVVAVYGNNIFFLSHRKRGYYLDQVVRVCTQCRLKQAYATSFLSVVEGVQENYDIPTTGLAPSLCRLCPTRPQACNPVSEKKGRF